MTLRAIEPRSLADQVFAQLVAEIVAGRYPVGSRLPSERTLTEIFGVNRHVVREAVKRLDQVGLVRTGQGGRAAVLDFTRTAGLDLLVLIAAHADAIEDALPLLSSAMEMRAGIGADVARLCAERASDEVRAALKEDAEQLAAVGRGRELLPLDQRFWQHVLDGAGNLAYQLAFNSLIRGVNAIPEFSTQWLEHELERSDYRRPLAAAIARGEPQLAETVARAALVLGTGPTAALPKARIQRSGRS